MEQKAIRQRVRKEIALHFTKYKKFIRPRDSILDIGAGTGNTANLIQARIPTVSLMGLDIINILKKPIPLTLYDGKIIPFHTSTFDVSLLFYVLHHIKDPKKILNEAARITKRTIIIIEEFPKPNANLSYNLSKEFEVLKAIGLSTDVHHNYLNLKKFLALISGTGFAVHKQLPLLTESEQKIDKYLYVLKRKSPPKASR